MQELSYHPVSSDLTQLVRQVGVSRMLYVGGEAQVNDLVRPPQGVRILDSDQSALPKGNYLFDFAIGNKVHLATPHTLIALLNTVALGWQQRQLAESAQKIVALGTRLYERIGVVAGHVATVGKQIEAAGSAYNKVVGSIETNLLTTARELRSLGVSAKDAPELAAIDPTPRPFVKPEVRNGEAA